MYQSVEGSVIVRFGFEGDNDGGHPFDWIIYSLSKQSNRFQPVNQTRVALRACAMYPYQRACF